MVGLACSRCHCLRLKSHHAGARASQAVLGECVALQYLLARACLVKYLDLLDVYSFAPSSKYKQFTNAGPCKQVCKISERPCLFAVYWLQHLEMQVPLNVNNEESRVRRSPVKKTANNCSSLACSIDQPSSQQRAARERAHRHATSRSSAGARCGSVVRAHVPEARTAAPRRARRPARERAVCWRAHARTRARRREPGR